MHLAPVGHEKLAIAVTKKIAENELARVRHEKPIKDGASKASAVPKWFFVIESVLMLRSCSQTM